MRSFFIRGALFHTLAAWHVLLMMLSLEKQFVPGLPKLKSSIVIASCIEILKPSPYRINPPCPLVPECGGCQLQHIEYSHQLYWKAAIIKECLERIGGIENPPVPFPLPSPSFFHYRCRANLKIVAGQNLRIGFYRRGTHQIIPVKECPLLVPELNHALACCWRVAEEHPLLFSGASDVNLVIQQHFPAGAHRSQERLYGYSTGGS